MGIIILKGLQIHIPNQHLMKPLFNKSLNQLSEEYGMRKFPPSFRDAKTEQAAKAEIFAANRNGVHVALVIGMITVIMFALLGNLFLPPELAQSLLRARIEIDLIFIMLAFILTLTPFGKKHLHQIFSTTIVWVSFTINFNALMEQTPVDVVQYYPGILLLLFFGYVFIRGNWYTALSAGVIIQISYLVFSQNFNMPTAAMIASNIYILAGNIVGATANYMMEFSTRREYWSRIQLEAQQNQLAEKNRELDQLIEEKSRQLKNSQAFVSNLNAGVANDLKSPLNSALGYFEILQQRNRDKIDDVNRSFVNEITRQCTRVKAMIDSLVEYSSVQSQAYQQAIVDLNFVVQIAQQKLNQKISAFGAEITVPTLPTILGDEQQLMLVFYHLLDNALKFHGEVLPKIVIASQYLAGEEQWLFRIQDNGTGIPSEDIDRLFGFFTRLDPTSEMSGLGMGLAISRQIIELHGGKLWIESAAGEGTTVFFTLKSIDVL